MTNEWLIWQLVDSAFPAGAFAHSAGLEAAWRAKLLGDDTAAGVEAFFQGVLRQAGHSAGPIVRAACARPAEINELDALSDAILTNHIANQASRAQGQAILLAAVRVFRIDKPTPAPGQNISQSSFHLAPTFGWVCNSLGLPPDVACRMFVFATLRSCISAAVRLGILGPLQAQRVQFELGQCANDAAELALTIPLTDIAQTFPLLELAQAGHDRLYSRLFQS